MHTITVSKNNKPIYVKKLVNEELAEQATNLFNKMITERTENPEAFSVVSEHDPDEEDTSVVNVKNGNPKYNKEANIESSISSIDAEDRSSKNDILINWKYKSSYGNLPLHDKKSKKAYYKTDTMPKKLPIDISRVKDL